mmetsp:Transcript_59023/g.175396  ORF Transcript_59023/g.175396 Transcript_59023/m.175396 type:complete len:285 (-) Transcript_59023:1379-2233(-)
MREVDLMIVLGRHMRQTDANHCTAACTSTICNCPRLVQSKISIVCELHCLPAGWDTNRVQRRQRSRRRARPPSSLRRCCERSLPAHAECTWQSSAVQAFRMGPSVGTEGDPCTVLNAHAGSVTCDPGIWREASRAVCSYFRKSKPVHCEMPIWRCNASTAVGWEGAHATDRARGAPFMQPWHANGSKSFGRTPPRTHREAPSNRCRLRRSRALDDIAQGLALSPQRKPGLFTAGRRCLSRGRPSQNRVGPGPQAPQPQQRQRGPVPRRLRKPTRAGEGERYSSW